MKTLLLPFFLALVEAFSGCAGPSPNPAAAVPTPTENLSLYRTDELLAAVQLCDQQVKWALTHGDNASAQQWAVRRGNLLDELRRRGVNPPPEATPTPRLTPAPTPRPVYRDRSRRVPRPTPTPAPLGLPGGHP